MSNTNQRSKSAEFLATHALLERGHQVSYPIVPAAYDLLVSTPHGGSVKRVQVKRAYRKRGETGWYVNLVRPGSKQRYRAGDNVDILMAVAVEILGYTVWMIPFERVIQYQRLVVSSSRWHAYRVVNHGVFLG
jgi:hypothetical protein